MMRENSYTQKKLRAKIYAKNVFAIRYLIKSLKIRKGLNHF